MAFIVTAAVVTGLASLLGGESIGFLTFEIKMPTISWYVLKVIFVSTALGGLWISYLLSELSGSIMFQGQNVGLLTWPDGLGVILVTILSVMFGFGIFEYIAGSGGSGGGDSDSD